MTAYRAIPKAVLTFRDPWGTEGTHGGERVHEADKSPVATGIVDASGTMIYRTPERHALGFDLRLRVRVKAVYRRL